MFNVVDGCKLHLTLWFGALVCVSFVRALFGPEGGNGDAVVRMIMVGERKRERDMFAHGTGFWVVDGACKHWWPLKYI